MLFRPRWSFPAESILYDYYESDKIFKLLVNIFVVTIREIAVSLATPWARAGEPDASQLERHGQVREFLRENTLWWRLNYEPDCISKSRFK